MYKINRNGKSNQVIKNHLVLTNLGDPRSKKLKNHLEIKKKNSIKSLLLQKGNL